MLLKAPIVEEGAREIARRARGTPRIANRLLRRVRDYAEVKGTGKITHDMADAALKMLDVDPVGFDLMDRKLLEAVLFKFSGGPVGIGQSGGRHWRRSGYHRGCSGTLPDPAGISPAHSTWTYRHDSNLSAFQALQPLLPIPTAHYGITRKPGEKKRPIDVAVGILVKDNGDILLAERPAGKPYEGYWEFPGGKVEAGETIEEALKREFMEELGIAIASADPWCGVEFVYPHAHVRLLLHQP